MSAGWECVCGARGLAIQYCPFCGRQAPDVAGAPPLPLHYAMWRAPDLPPRAGLTPLARVLTALVAVVFAIGSVTVVRRTDWTAPAALSPVESPEPTESASPPPPDLAAAIHDARVFVAEYRGRAFKRDVEVRLLGDAAFLKALNGGDTTDDEPTDSSGFAATLRGLRLSDPGDDLDKEQADLLDAGIVGFYDQHDERLYVRGRTLTPYTRMVLVHELTHAWQDQHFDLDDLDERVETDDAQLALRALVEGDATRTENAWRAKQPAPVRREIQKVEDSFDNALGDKPSRTIRTLAALYGFAYDVGPAFAEAVADDGGNAALDEAFLHPPTTTEQALHPDKYLAAEGAAEVKAPKAEGLVKDSGSLGEVGLILIAGRGDVTERALKAAAGWGGDAYVTWKHAGVVCTGMTIAMDNDGERDALLAVLNGYGWGPGGSVGPDGATRVRLVSCA